MKKEKTDVFFLMLFLIALAHLTYVFVMKELAYQFSDYNGHVYVYLPNFLKRDTLLDAWKMVPYCAYHIVTLLFYKLALIPLDVSAAYAAILFAVFSYLAFYWILQRFSVTAKLENGSLKNMVLSFCLCIVQPLNGYWMDAAPYSMNPLYNPTYMCARGFSILCFFLVCDIFGRQKSENYCGYFFRVEEGLTKHYVLLGILLFFSAMAKPTYAEMLIPAVAFTMLVEWIYRIARKNGTAKPYFQHCLYMLLCALPTLAYIFLQFAAYFLFGGSYGDGGSLTITKFLEVWSVYSQNVVLALALSLAFPLFMILLDPASFLTSEAGRLSLVCLFISFLEAAFLGESGPKLLHFDFIWPLMSAMLLLFTVSTLRLLSLESHRATTLSRRILLGIAWFLFALHALAGLQALTSF
ncbi:MAG: hypothetical protein E7295_02555 [Lachnospiraceae bacterium]|jgi:hypothetical protein|nr:hypothetical protein [Lachnospiraceae bacterium]